MSVYFPEYGTNSGNNCEMEKKVGSQSVSLDHGDRSLLRIVQENRRRSLEEIADAAGMSKSAAQRRLQRLREEKIIVGDVAIVDQRRVGPLVTMLVEIEFERDRPDYMSLFQKWIGSNDHVQQAWCITGRGDYTLVVITESIDGFDVFMEQLMEENRYVRKFTTSVVLRTVKQGLAVPISPR